MPRTLRALGNPPGSWQLSGFLATLFYPGRAGPGWALPKPGPAGLGFLKIRNRPGPDRNPDRNPEVEPGPLRSLIELLNGTNQSRDKCLDIYVF
jgi:hypothetical protein